MARSKPCAWVVAGGAPGEIGHCTRCGQGLRMEMPQDLRVVTAAMRAFVKAHSGCRDTGRTEPRPLVPGDWARGRDTGISSATIYTVVTGNAPIYEHFDVPHDCDDFGRCYRFLKLFPEYRPRLPEVALRFPEWSRLVENWDELTRLYEAALESDQGRALYDRLQQLIGEAVA